MLLFVGATVLQWAGAAAAATVRSVGDGDGEARESNR
jgi:hypothetical protein